MGSGVDTNDAPAPRLATEGALSELSRSSLPEHIVGRRDRRATGLQSDGAASSEDIIELTDLA
jgi:hypothetical protein